MYPGVNEMKFNRKRSWRAVALVALSFSIAACGGREERMATHMARAKAYYEQANYDKARVEFRNVLQIDPKSAEASYFVGRIEEEQQNWQNAFNSYRRAVELDPALLDAKVSLGKLYILSGMIAETQKLADDVLARQPGHSGGLFLQAAIAARRSDTATAIDDAKQSIAADATNTDAVSLLGGLYSRAGDTAKAQRVLEEGVKASPRNVPLRIDLASVLQREKAFDAAERVYQEIIAIAPDKLAYRAGLAQFYLRTNRRDKAERVLRDAIKADPDDTQRYLVLVDFLAETKGADEAEKELRAAIQNKPKTYALQFSLAHLYELTAKPELAKRTYGEIIASGGTAPDGLRARTRLARLELEGGNMTAADRYVAEVLKENPKDSDGLQLRARMALADGDTARAVADLRSVLKDHPDSVEVVTQLVRAHVANGEPQLAKDVLDNAIVRYPHDAQLRVALADYLVSTGDRDAALKELDNALDADPRSVSALEMKADIEAARQRWADAESTLGRLKSAYPEQPLGYYRLGLLYQAQKKYDQALNEFEAAQKKAPGAIESLAAIVDVLQAQGKTDRAIARVEQARQAFPNGVTPEMLLAEIYRTKGKYAEAEAALRKAIAIDSKAAGPYWRLANLYLARGNDQGAVNTLRQGLSANPGDRALSHALAEAYQKEHDNDKAISEYEGILKRSPADAIAANNLASLLTETKGDKASLERALQLARRFEHVRNPAFVDTLGRVYFKLGQNDLAVPLLEKAAAGAPKQPVYAYHLGLALYKKGDTQRARERLQQAVDAKVDFPGIEDAKGILARM